MIEILKQGFRFMKYSFGVIVIISTFFELFISKSYFKFYFYQNYKSLSNKEKYMDIDTLYISHFDDTVYKDSDSSNRISAYIEGETSTEKNIKIKLPSLKLVQNNYNKQPVYRSKLSGTYFLKTSNKNYYKNKKETYILVFFYKLYFYVVIFVIFKKTIKFYNSK